MTWLRDNNTHINKTVKQVASQANEVVMLQCACGCNFEREKSFLGKYEEYKTEFPTAARFYKRKITYCDKCLNERMKASIKRLPDILRALAT
tara:strand:- start:262 stop:537 length:276 start_codon:yes stop_codon:yes gene_type:complete